MIATRPVSAGLHPKHDVATIQDVLLASIQVKDYSKYAGIQSSSHHVGRASRHLNFTVNNLSKLFMMGAVEDRLNMPLQ